MIGRMMRTQARGARERIAALRAAAAIALALCAHLALPAPPLRAQTQGQDLTKQTQQAEISARETGYGQVVSEQRGAWDIPKLEQAVDPDRYVLGPYDRLLVNLVGPDPRTFTIVVLPEGYVFLPGMGAIRADGSTLTDFRRRLVAEVERHFRNIEVFCYLQEPRIFRVFVTGEVARPGAVDVSAVQRVTDAIEKAGSILSAGSNRRSLLIRGADTVHVDVLRHVLKGEFESNPFLSNGDRIHVPVAKAHAVVRGSVAKSSSYEILPGETVADLIDLAGGFTGEAVRDTVLLTRVADDGSVATFAIPEERFDAVLQDRDEINILDRMAGANRVYVFGATAQTGNYFITEGEGLRTLVGRISKFNLDADLSAATLERADGTITRVDLKLFIPPTTVKDIPLSDGDILHVPRVDQTVAVGGEVQLPGRVPYTASWTVAQYIGAVGGPTRDGSIDRVIIISTSGVSRSGNRDAVPNSGDVLIVKRSKTRIFSDIFGGLIGLGTLIISIIALTD
ncbi:MAG: SLBB domain-containing protein [Candidatus Krumholzibacteria bacterium]|nr:SLBB domain-containing protein [Candidatus Krumholzibacteria bacterium]